MKPLTLIDPKLRPELSLTAHEVTTFDRVLRELADGMTRLMYEKKGIGLAANQVGELQRVIVFDVGYTKGRIPMVLVNPRIVKSRGTQTMREGCLSFPGRRVEVTRAAHVKIAYQDLDGDAQTLKAANLAAQCIQHEIDHLNGICRVAPDA